jgi:tetratricopeptide (TPR) repeat protein
MVVLLIPTPGRGDDGWTGKVVIITRPGVIARGTLADGPKNVALQDPAYEVLQEKDGRLLIEQDGTKAWIDKNDALLPADAIEHVSKRLNTDPKSADLFARRAAAFQGLSNARKAEEDLNEAVCLRPEVATYWRQRAGARLQGGFPQLALDDLTEAIRLDPRDIYALQVRGSLRCFGSDPDGALADADAMLRINGKLTLPYFIRGTVWLSKGDLRQAKEAANAGLAVNAKEAGMYDLRAAAWLGLGDPGQASADLTEAIRVCPTRHRYCSRAAIHVMNKDYRKALADIEEALKLEPTNSDAIAARGQCRADMGDLAEALNDFDRALEINKSEVRARIGRGVVRAKQRRYAEALSEFENVIKAHEDSSEGYLNASWLLATCPEAAVRDGEKALSLARKGCEVGKWAEARGFDRLAAAYAETGDFEQAVYWQEKAMAARRSVGGDATGDKRRLEDYQNKKPCRDEW